MRRVSTGFRTRKRDMGLREGGGTRGVVLTAGRFRQRSIKTCADDKGLIIKRKPPCSEKFPLVLGGAHFFRLSGAAPAWMRVHSSRLSSAGFAPFGGGAAGGG